MAPNGFDHLHRQQIADLLEQVKSFNNRLQLAVCDLLI